MRPVRVVSRPLPVSGGIRGMLRGNMPVTMIVNKGDPRYEFVARGVIRRPGAEGWWFAWFDDDGPIGYGSQREIHMDVDTREIVALLLIAAWLSEGERGPSGTWVRMPADCFWQLPVANGGQAGSVEEAELLLTVSVARVLLGAGPILGRIDLPEIGSPTRVTTTYGIGDLRHAYAGEAGWTLVSAAGRTLASGPECHADGWVALTRAAVLRGYAVRLPDRTLSVPISNPVSEVSHVPS